MGEHTTTTSGPDLSPRYAYAASTRGYTVYRTDTGQALETYREEADAARAASRWNTWGDGWLGLRQ